MNNETKKTTIFDNIPAYNTDNKNNTFTNYEKVTQNEPTTSVSKQSGIFDNIKPYNNDITENKTAVQSQEPPINVTNNGNDFQNKVTDDNILSSPSQSNIQTDIGSLTLSDEKQIPPLNVNASAETQEINKIASNDTSENINNQVDSVASAITTNQQSQILDNITPNTYENTTSFNETSNDSIPLKSDKKNSRKKPKIIFLLGVLVVIIVLIIIAYNSYKNLQNQNVFKLAVNNAFDYLSSNINEYSSFDGDFTIKMNCSSQDTDADKLYNSILNQIDISGTYGIDIENKIFSLKLNTNYKNYKLLNLTAYSESSKAYLYLDDIYDKYIMASIDDYESYFDNSNQAEYKTIISSLKEAIIASLKDEYFTTTEDTLNDTKVNKTTLNLTSEVYNDIKSDIINSLLNDEEFITALIKVTNYDSETIKENLQEKLDNDDIEIADTEISIYTKTNYDFVKLLIVNENGNLTVAYDDNKYSYEVTDSATSLEGYISIITEDDTTTYELSVTEDGITIGYTITNTINYNTTIDKLDVSNSIDYNDISEEELDEIYNSIFENEGILNLVEDTANMFEEIGNMYNYSYFSFENENESVDL